MTTKCCNRKPLHAATWTTAVIVAGLAPSLAEAEAAARKADFIGDGFSDLAIGVDGEDVNGPLSAGGVAVIYGRDSHGLSADGCRFLR